VALAAAGSFEACPRAGLRPDPRDLGPLVFSDHALELHKELVLRRHRLWRRHEDGLDTMAGEFFDQQGLIGVFAAEPVGRMHQHDLDLTFRREIA
jgi:hypothetical protein